VPARTDCGSIPVPARRPVFPKQGVLLKQATSLALVLAVLAAIGTGAAIDRANAAGRAVAMRDPAAVQIGRYRAETLRWQQVMGRPLTPPRPVRGLPPVELWKSRALSARKQALNPPHKRQWLCIHRYEAPWHAHTGNGYYGGLQMDVGFQRYYAARLLRRKGTADHWTPIEQMWVAERAHRESGFHPWPNTARMCGLI
jgi:hypothetical protein